MLVTATMKNALGPVSAPLAAIGTGAYLYPFRGLIYFACNPILWGSVFAMAVPQLVLTFVVFTLSYTFLYPPQAALGVLFNGPTGLLTAWIAMVQESAAITQVVSAIFLMPTPLRIIFDSIMIKEGHDNLVLAGKLRRRTESSDNQKIFAFVKRAPLYLIWPVWLLRLAFRIALNFIPVIGPVILVLVDATGVGERCESRYFDLKGFSAPEKKKYVQQKLGEFFAFGLVAAALEALPFVGVMFMFTNTAGGALWAADIEQRTSIYKTINPRKRRMRFFFD